MLKLCLALPIFYPTFGGGPLRVLRAQAGLRKRDVHARVLAGSARRKDDFHSADVRSADGSARRDDAPIGAMSPVEHVDGIPVHRVRLPANTGVRRTSTYFKALIELCENPTTRPDVIQLHSFERFESLYWLSRLRRLEIPIVHSIQIARPVRRRSALGRLAERSLRRAFYERFDGVLTNSDTIRSALRDWSIRTPIEVIPNGVDLASFRDDRDASLRARTRESLGVRGSGPLILSVGAVCPRKGSDLLVSAWQRLLDRRPDAELVFVGPRHDRNNRNLRRFAHRLREAIDRSPHPQRVHFAGVRDDMNAVYAAADVVVLPSSREGMPNAVLEAMACERPVLLTPFLGQSSALGRPGFEYSESERSATALAENLGILLDDPVRRAHLVRNGRAWIERRLDLESNLDHLADFYRRAAERCLDFEGLHE